MTHYFFGSRVFAAERTSMPAAYSIAFFCQTCGDIWARVLVEESVMWNVETIPCKEHPSVNAFDWLHIPGSISQGKLRSELGAPWHARAFDSLPLSVQNREIAAFIEHFYA